MSANVKLLLLTLVLAIISGAVLYFYFNSETYVLLREAERLWEQDDIYGAHEKAQEAVVTSPLNRRAVALKSRLYFEVNNDAEFREGLKQHEEGLSLMRRYEYYGAALAFDSAQGHFGNVRERYGNTTERAPQYDQAQTLSNEIFKLETDLKESMQYYSFNNAMRLYRNGELARAFDQLTQVPHETEQVIQFKNEIAFALGYNRYEEIVAAPGTFAETYYNDALYWLRQVTVGSAEYDQAQELMNNLNVYLQNK